jgi:beta-lactamase class A
MRVPRQRLKIVGIIAASLVFIVVLSWISWTLAINHDRDIEHKYPLLDPSVSNPDMHQQLINFDPLRQNIKNYLAGLKVQHSFYFEYLPNGTSIRDGDDNISQAASLMKTPIAMDLYKMAEQGKLNLDEKVTVKQSQISTDPEFGNTTGLHAGDQITLRHAVEIMLHNSDNTAFAVIGDRIRPLLNDSTDSIQSLDISFNVNGNKAGNEQVLISARSYASVLKCIYYACFNSPQDSTTTINYLTGATDNKRLMAGVLDSSIPVAHKVGSSPTTQSDCGIIYYPSRPYLVCLMFFNIPIGANVDPYFQEVSQSIYEYINSYSQR